MKFKSKVMKLRDINQHINIRSLNYDTNLIICDLTIEKYFQKYLKQIMSGITIGIEYNFVFNNDKVFKGNIDHWKFIFVFEFPNEKTAFYFELKYNLELTNV